MVEISDALRLLTAILRLVVVLLTIPKARDSEKKNGPKE